LVCLALVAAVYWIAVRKLLSVPIAFDESYFLWTGWSVNHGLTPYRDFVEYKPPVIFFVNALSLKLLGLDHHRYRLLFAFLSAGGFMMVAGALLRRGADWVLTFCAVAAIELAVLAPGLHDSGLNDAETLGMSFYLLGVGLLLWPGSRRAATAAAGGAFLTLAVLSKEPYAFVCLASWVALGFWNRDEQGVPWRHFARWTILGAAAVAFVVVGYLAVTGSIPYYVSAMREYLGYLTRLGHCTQPTSFSALTSVMWDKLSTNLTTRDLLGGVVPFLAAFAVSDRARLPARLAVVAAVLAGCHAVSLGGCYFRHYFVMGLAGLFLWACLGVLALSPGLAAAPRPLVLWIRVSMLTVMIMLYGPRIDAEAKGKFKSEAVDLMGLPAAIVDFVKKNSAPTDYVFTDGMPSLFLLTDRLRPMRDGGFLDELIDSYPGRTDVEKLSRIRAQLDQRKPKVVYLDNDHLARKRRTRAALLMPFLTEHGYKEVMPNLYLRP
jgi:hypothetical protein